MPPEIMKLIMPDEKNYLNTQFQQNNKEKNTINLPNISVTEKHVHKEKIVEGSEGALPEKHLTFKLGLSNIWLFLSISLGICLILLLCLKKL